MAVETGKRKPEADGGSAGFGAADRPESDSWRARARRLLAALASRDRSGELALPLRELATLLSAGVPLVRGLEATADQAEDAGVRRVLEGARDTVIRGEPMSRAAAEYPSYFGPVARNMLAAGEQAGNLEMALRRLSDQLLRRRELKGRVAGALLYPGILAVISGIVVVFLLSYVVPRVSAIYSQPGVKLPAPTRALLAVSGVVGDWWPVMLAGALAAYVAFRLMDRYEPAALWWDGFKLGLPFVGGLYRKRAVAEFSATLAALLETGVPLLNALRTTGSVLDNRAMSRDVRRVAAEVEVGRAASAAIGERALFPRTVAEIMAAGEESGELEELLRTLADDYSRQVEMAADRACRALEPLVVVLMGAVVLFIVLAVLLPIVRIGEIIQL